MSTLYLMRHGPAEEGGPNLADADRRLTEDGKRKVIEAARGLKAFDVAPQIIVSSPLVRAWKTAELVAEVLGQPMLKELRTLVPGGDPDRILRSLEPYERVSSMILVGHLPSIEELASYLLTGSSTLVALPFKKAAVAAIEVGSVPPRHPGALLWFMTAKQLRR